MASLPSVQRDALVRIASANRCAPGDDCGGCVPVAAAPAVRKATMFFWCFFFAWDITVTALTQNVIHCRVVKSALDGSTSMHTIFFP
jgi:hypothetical protein